MKGLSMMKRVMVGAVAAAALAGPVTAAHALQFSQGDAVLAVYGNSTEYLANLGTISNLVTNGASLDLSSIMGSVGGTNPIRYTLFGFSDPNTLFFGDGSTASSFTTSQKNTSLPASVVSALQGYSGALVNAADARNLFPLADALSFTSNLNPDSSNTFGGNISSAHPAVASIDHILNLLTANDPGTGIIGLSQVATALLSSSNGSFVVSVSAVPVPAAVVLFATGVIGLVGLARRRMSGTQPDAA
jgi:hypothetical protein